MNALPPIARRLLWAALLLPLAEIVYPGCATVVNGPTESICVVSRPSKAQLFLNGHAIGATPQTVTVSRWGFHRLRVELPGFEPAEIPLHKTVNELAPWNLLIGFVPIVIDVVTGAVFQLEAPAPFHDPKPDYNASADIYIRAELHPTGTGRKIAQLRRK